MKNTTFPSLFLKNCVKVIRKLNKRNVTLTFRKIRTQLNTPKKHSNVGTIAAKWNEPKIVLIVFRSRKYYGNQSQKSPEK